MLGMFAILASLVFLGIQVRQEHLLARSELGSATVELVANQAWMATNQEIANALAKSINQPSELSDGEIIQVNEFLWASALLMMRECYLVERGVFAECDGVVDGQLSAYFANSYAQAWWRHSHEQSRIRYLPKWVNDKISELDPNANQRTIESIKDDL